VGAKWLDAGARRRLVSQDSIAMTERTLCQMEIHPAIIKAHTKLRVSPSGMAQAQQLGVIAQNWANMLSQTRDCVLIRLMGRGS
jgi:hypothetical protein